MVSYAQMKELIETDITKNEWLDLSSIQDFIKLHFELDKEDMKPWLPNNSYPKWKGTLQKVLHHYVKDKKADHHERIPAKLSKDGVAKDPQYFFFSM